MNANSTGARRGSPADRQGSDAADTCLCLLLSSWLRGHARAVTIQQAVQLLRVFVRVQVRRSREAKSGPAAQGGQRRQPRVRSLPSEVCGAATFASVIPDIAYSERGRTAVEAAHPC